MPNYRILSLDGGGIGGLFTCTLLARLVNAHPNLIANTDLIAGTSTGGIIALALAAGVPIAELVALYSTRGTEIFDDSFWDNIRDLGNAVGADYSNKGLKRNLKRILGDTTLADLRRTGARKHVLIPTFDLDAPAAPGRPRTWKPKFFHNFAGNDSDGAELAVDVALRTAAAPTYFPAYQGYIDGGVVANNPSMAAIAQALDPRAAGRELRDIRLLSISTGTDPKYIKGENLDWGWGQWARPLVSIMISGVMGVADFQCSQILGDRYLRLDRVFDRPVNLDDIRPQTIQYLIAQANAVDLAEAQAWLAAHW